jgi:hypothetical protein
MIKHTEGPWEFERKPGLGFEIYSNEGPILKINGGMIPTEHDAKIMTAAPELLACVEGLLTNFPQLGTDEDLNGADLVDWINDQLPYWKLALKKAGVLK